MTLHLFSRPQYCWCPVSERRAPLQHEGEGKGASQALYVQSFLHRDSMAGPWAAQLLESIHKFTV